MTKKELNPKKSEERFCMTFLDIISAAIGIIMGVAIFLIGFCKNEIQFMFFGSLFIILWTINLTQTERRKQFDYIIKLIEQRTSELAGDVE